MPEETRGGKEWRVDVELVPPDQSLLLRFSSRAEAVDAIVKSVKDGFVIQDHSADQTKYEFVYYPIVRVRRFHVYERDAVGLTGNKTAVGMGMGPVSVQSGVGVTADAAKK